MDSIFKEVLRHKTLSFLGSGMFKLQLTITYAKGGRGGGDSWTGCASSTVNRGNGGGGGGADNALGGNGGSGIVIIRYPI